jgi:hypothetical protein
MSMPRSSAFVSPLLFVLTILCALLYDATMVHPSRARAVRWVTETLPIPAASVNGSWILYREVGERDLEYLIREEAIEQLALSYHVRVEQRDIMDVQRETDLSVPYARGLLLAQGLSEALAKDGKNLEEEVEHFLLQARILVFLRE